MWGFSHILPTGIFIEYLGSACYHISISVDIGLVKQLTLSLDGMRRISIEQGQFQQVLASCALGIPSRAPVIVSAREWKGEALT